VQDSQRPCLASFASRDERYRTNRGMRHLFKSYGQPVSNLE